MEVPIHLKEFIVIFQDIFYDLYGIKLEFNYTFDRFEFSDEVTSIQAFHTSGCLYFTYNSVSDNVWICLKDSKDEQRIRIKNIRKYVSSDDEFSSMFNLCRFLKTLIADYNLEQEFLNSPAAYSDSEILQEIEDLGLALGGNLLPFDDEVSRHVLDLIKKFPKTWQVVKESLPNINSLLGEDHQIYLTFLDDFFCDPIDGFLLYVEDEGDLDDFTKDLARGTMNNYYSEKCKDRLVTVSFEVYP